MPRIGIITGVKTEQRALAPILGAENSPMIRLSGARPMRARAGVEALIEAGVDGILSFGTAGSLSTDLSPGTIVIGACIAGSDNTSYECDPAWVDAMASTLEAMPVNVVGADQVLSRRAKTHLFEQTGHLAIDMESHIAADLANQAGIPFAVLRAIVDPVDFEFPEFVLDSIRPDGSVSLLPIVAGLCIQPWLLGRLLDLNKYNNAAMESLSRATRILGPRCGLGLLAR